MDIAAQLAAEHSKSLTDRLIVYAGEKPQHLHQLIELVLGSDRLLAQRASWPLSYAVLQHLEWAKPYEAKMLKHLLREDIHDAEKRNLLRIWMHSLPDEKHLSTLFDRCFELARRSHEAGAVRAFSIQVLGHIAAPYSELREEVQYLLADLEQESTPAIRSSTRTVLKLFKKL